MDTLAENLRAARRLKGLTQEQLAERAGVSQTTIDKIEQGKTIKSRFLPNIAFALGVTTESLDPSLAKAMEDWERMRREHPENFYQMRVLDELPIYTSNPLDEYGIFSLGEKLPWKVPSPRWLDGNTVFCISWAGTAMSPEVEDGDAVFFEIGGSLYAGKTGLFMTAHQRFEPPGSGGLYCLARLVMADEYNWTVRLINGETNIILPIKDWPFCAPMRVRYCGNNLQVSAKNR